MQNSMHVERAKKRITQKELAKEVGVSRQTIINIENGKFQPGTVLAIKISNFFGKTVKGIFELENTD